MATDINAIADREGIAGDVTRLIKKGSIAFNVCDIQNATTSNPSVFGVKKASGSTGLTIQKKICSLGSSANSEEFTDELVEDIFNLYGKDAEEQLKIIGANSIIDDIDNTLITYMKGIATEETPVSYDFSTGTPKDHIDDLILKINKTRVAMSKVTQRGLPKNLIVSDGVASLLITNKIISGSDSDYVAGGPDNIKFLGKIGDMQVYHDLASTSDYILFLHKTMVPGDASVILAPINDVNIQIKPDAESGEPHLYMFQRYAYSQNPLDTSGANASDFVRSLGVTITNL
jgi:hypothetical protein